MSIYNSRSNRIKEANEKNEQNTCNKQFVEQFNGILAFLTEIQNVKEVKNLNEKQIKEICGQVVVLIAEFNQQPYEFQLKVNRNDMVNALTKLMQTDNLKCKIKIVKNVMICLKYMNFQSKNKDMMNILIFVFLEALKLSKEPENDGIFIEEAFTDILLEYAKIILTGWKKVREDDDLEIEIIQQLLNLLKNQAGQVVSRQKMLETDNLYLISQYFHVVDEFQTQSMMILIHLTGLMRNLAIDPQCTLQFLEQNIVKNLANLIQKYPQNYDLMLNILRLFSKISLNSDCCNEIMKNKECIKNMVGFFRTYKTNMYVIIRISFIFANISSFFQEIREYLYIQCQAFKDIYACYDYYYNQDMNPQKQETTDKFGQSYASWDFQIIKQESAQDALIKLIRLLANLMTVTEIGSDFLTNKTIYYKDILKKSKSIFQYKDQQKSSELIITTLSWLSNMIYYEKSVILNNDFELKKCKQDVVSSLPQFIIQIENEDICIESLRILANVSRQKDYYKLIKMLKLVDALIILLNHSSKEIVFFTIGVIINIMNDEDIRKTYQNQAIQGLISVLKDCTMDDFDILSNTLRAIGNIIDYGKKDINQSHFKSIQEICLQFGDECDIIITYEEQNQNEVQEIYDLRNIINSILENIPEQQIICNFPNCGRSFKSNEELTQHIERRHSQQKKESQQFNRIL